jgi:hypothetical protein
MDINRNAPVIASAEAYIEAPLSLVWAVHTDLCAWPEWNAEVTLINFSGPLSPGTHSSGNQAVFRSPQGSRQLIRSGRSDGRGAHRSVSALCIRGRSSQKMRVRACRRRSRSTDFQCAFAVPTADADCSVGKKHSSIEMRSATTGSRRCGITRQLTGS